MPLNDYQRKRKFDVTAEPSGKGRVSAGQRFVVQKHAASRLHYDFRLEVAGVLKSWALPHGPSLDPSDKVLAVEVEDHPIDYANFEGTIPAGEYGGGTVMVWDRGTWELEEDHDLEQLLKGGKATFRLHGEKLNGLWTLVRMRAQGQKNWLLIKKQDDFAVSKKEKDILATAPKSVLTGRDLSQIADNEKPVRGRTKSARPESAGKLSAKSSTKSPAKSSLKSSAETSAKKKRSVSKAVTTKRAAKSNGQHDDAPGRSKKSAVSAKLIAEHLHETPLATKKQLDSITPQLATLSDEMPEGDRWLHELKLDGYRILARINGGKVRLLTRRGLDWSDHFPKVAEAVAKLPLDGAILDGEVVALDDKGVSDFQRLQNWMAQKNQNGLIYYVFDLPFVEQHDLTDLPLIERKKILAQVLLKHSPSNDGIIRYHDHIVGSGKEVLQHACNYSMEGVVSKKVDSRYVSRRSGSWLKVKCLHQQEFVIAGYTSPSGERTGFGALLLGYYEGKDLIYCGRVGTGFSQTSLRELTKRCKALEVDKCPYAKTPERSQLKGVTWLEPKLVAEIIYATRTQEGLLRHAVFHGLREDKLAKKVVLEKPVSHSKADRGSASTARTSPTNAAKHSRRSKVSRPTSANAKPVEVQAIGRAASSDDPLAVARISNPDRVVYQEPELTKVDIAQYLLDVAPWMLPSVVGRPLTLLRCPQGSFGKCFFQKHLDDRFPEGVRGVEIQEDKKREPYPVIDDQIGLLSLAQMSVLEIHLWPAMADDVELPDRMVFDLDPGEEVKWSWVVQGARDIRKLLKQVGIESFVRTSGGKGLHVVAPFDRTTGDWDQLKQFTSAVAHSLAEQHSDRYVATMSKALRRGKVFIDYLRNQRGATTVASFSPRARVGAHVATPISWRELNDELTNDDFSVVNLLQRLKRQRTDPWKGFDELRQALPSVPENISR